MEPTLRHVEIILLLGEIVSLIGSPPALVGKLIALENFVAELLEHGASEQVAMQAGAYAALTSRAVRPRWKEKVPGGVATGDHRAGR
jgi:hypothetical protein